MITVACCLYTPHRLNFFFFFLSVFLFRSMCPYLNLLFTLLIKKSIGHELIYAICSVILLIHLYQDCITELNIFLKLINHLTAKGLKPVGVPPCSESAPRGSSQKWRPSPVWHIPSGDTYRPQ